MEGCRGVSACVLLVFVSMVKTDSSAADLLLEHPLTPKESSVEVPHREPTTPPRLPPNLDPSKVTESYNHSVNTVLSIGSHYSLNYTPDTNPQTIPLLHPFESSNNESTPASGVRLPQEVKSPVPTIHNVPLTWSVINPTHKFSPSPLFSEFPENLPVEPPLPFADMVAPSSKIIEFLPEPSRDPNIQRDPGYQDLEPSRPVFVHPMTSPNVELTMSPPEDFYPTNTMDMDYGSGDYLETMSFLGSEGDYTMVTTLPSDMYDFEDSYSETYDTTFPTRIIKLFSSKHFYPSSTSVEGYFSSSSVLNVSSTSEVFIDSTKQATTMKGFTSVLPFAPSHSVTPQGPVGLSSDFFPSSSSSAYSIQPTASDVLNLTHPVKDDMEAKSNISGTGSIQPSDVLLPDMNSLEFYTIQLTKDLVSPSVHSTASPKLIGTMQISSTSAYTIDSDYLVTALFDEALQPADNNSWTEESSSDISGFEPFNISVFDPSEVKPSLTNTTIPFSKPLYTPTPSMKPHSFLEGQKIGVAMTTVVSNVFLVTSHSTPSVTNEPVSLSSTSNVSQSILASNPTETSFPSTVLPPDVESTSVFPHLTDSTRNITFSPLPTEMADEGFMSGSPLGTSIADDNSTPVFPTTISVLANDSTTTLFTNTVVTTAITTPATTTSRKYICNITNPDAYLTRVGFPPGSNTGFAKTKVREILKADFNRSVELQVVKSPPDFVFRVVSGEMVFSAVSVINALRISDRTSFISVSPIIPVPDLQFHIHSVLQFVPSHIDVHLCTFSEQIEKGLATALSEVRRRTRDTTDFTVTILNITLSPGAKASSVQKVPVEITFVVQDTSGYVAGTEISTQLRQLSVVEYSYYLGYPVQMIAEPFHYPELNTTQMLRSSWVKTVLLGVLDQRVNERVFQATIERRLALLLGDALGTGRRFRRATSAGNNSVQIVKTTRLVGPDNPLEITYFVEGANGQRLPASATANVLNGLDMQHAAIVMGFRIQGVLAQPVEKQHSDSSDTEKTNTWIIIGVVVPVVVVVIIISILYWKLCRTDKLEFQPDAMSNVQQRQKLQAPSVKGFDFAKLHMGQHSKDDLMVIQEPLPVPVPAKPAENGEVATPGQKIKSSTKASCNGQRRRGQISPSEADSIGSDPTSERGSPEENLRSTGFPIDPKQTRKAANGLNGPPPLNGLDEPLSSASIFEHVDRMSRPSDGPNRLPSRIQLIAMQPMPALPFPSSIANDRENDKLSKEIQVALRHKSEIEHHRNKIRLRAKRKGHYDFPTMDDLIDGLGDPKEQDRIYQKAQMQIDKILDPDLHMPSLYMEPKKSSSSRGKRSPKLRRKQQVNGDLEDADRDRLITTDSDGTYRKHPGVSNIAYVSDPDQCPDHLTPSPTDEVFHGPVSPPGHPPPPPPPYLPPQPSIEEARQQMHSLLDDAFALVSPSSQGSTAGVTLPGGGMGSGGVSPSSPPCRGPRNWGPGYQPVNPYTGRYADFALPPSAVQGVLHRQGLGSAYIPSSDALPVDQLPPELLYSGRGLHSDELPSTTRPRPVGGTAGAHLSQAGRVGETPHPGSLNWGLYHEDDHRFASSRESASRKGSKEPCAPPLDCPLQEPCPPSHSSASLIKAIREELMRLSQKQAAVPSYHS